MDSREKFKWCRRQESMERDDAGAPIQRHQIILNNDNVLCGINCGGDRGCGNGPFQQRMCCQSGLPDCGGFPGFLHPKGPAIADVMEFAEKEDVWIAEFLDAWHKATTNGMLDSLQPLGIID